MRRDGYIDRFVEQRKYFLDRPHKMAAKVGKSVHSGPLTALSLLQRLHIGHLLTFLSLKFPTISYICGAKKQINELLIKLSVGMRIIQLTILFLLVVNG